MHTTVSIDNECPVPDNEGSDQIVRIYTLTLSAVVCIHVYPKRLFSFDVFHPLIDIHRTWQQSCRVHMDGYIKVRCQVDNEGHVLPEKWQNKMLGF